jgi:hypothetical protein
VERRLRALHKTVALSLCTGTLLNIDASGHRTIGNRPQDGKRAGLMNVSRASVRLKGVKQGNNGSKYKPLL